MLQPRRSRACRLATLLLLGVLIGCGQFGHSGAEVSGRVTANGAPLPEGLITFVPEPSTPELRTVSAVVTNGEFHVPQSKSLLPGTYRVRITAERKSGRKKPAGEGASGTVDVYEQYIPPKYNARTTLSLVVTGNMDDVVFALEVPS